MPRTHLTRARRGARRPAVAALSLVMATLGVSLASGGSPAGALTSHSTPPFASVAGVACPAKSECIAVGNATYNPTTFATTAGALYSTKSGASWSVGTVPSGFSGLYGLDCVSTTTCYATAAKTTSNGAVLVTTNANSKSGPTWKVHTLPNVSGGPFSSPNSISCPSKTRCYVVGSSNEGTDPALVQVSISGSSLSFTVMPAPASGGVTNYPTELYAVSCASTSSCVAVGGDAGDVAGGFQLGEGHWSLSSFSSSLATLWGVDCVAKSDDCYATVASTLAAPPVGAIVESTNGGKSWKDQKIPSSTAGVYAISCTTTARCAAVGYDQNGDAIALTKRTGSKFSSAKVPTGKGPMFAVDCESTTDCVAGGSSTDGLSGQLLRTTTFTTWTAATIK